MKHHTKSKKPSPQKSNIHRTVCPVVFEITDIERKALLWILRKCYPENIEKLNALPEREILGAVASVVLQRVLAHPKVAIEMSENYWRYYHAEGFYGRGNELALNLIAQRPEYGR